MSIAHFAGASSSAGQTIDINGTSVFDFALSPADAYAGYRLLSTGEEQDSSGGTWDTIGSFPPGIGLECRLTWTGDALAAGSDATGTWLALSSNRGWNYFINTLGVKTGSGTIEIRNGSGVVIASASVSLNAEVEME